MTMTTVVTLPNRATLSAHFKTALDPFIEKTAQNSFHVTRSDFIRTLRPCLVDMKTHLPREIEKKSFFSGVMNGIADILDQTRLEMATDVPFANIQRQWKSNMTSLAEKQAAKVAKSSKDYQP
jgi:hypothetical protein